MCRVSLWEEFCWWGRRATTLRQFRSLLQILSLSLTLSVCVPRNTEMRCQAFDFGLHRSWHWLDVGVILNPWRGAQWQSLPMSIKFSLGMLNLLWLQLPPGNSSRGFYYCFWTAGQPQPMYKSSTVCVWMHVQHCIYMCLCVCHLQ